MHFFNGRFKPLFTLRVHRAQSLRFNLFHSRNNTRVEVQKYMVAIHKKGDVQVASR